MMVARAVPGLERELELVRSNSMPYLSEAVGARSPRTKQHGSECSAILIPQVLPLLATLGPFSVHVLAVELT